MGELLFAVLLCGLPLLVLIVLRWNELWYAFPLNHRLSRTGAKLPPGSMGLPFIGETLTFLWYFKFVRRPDEFIQTKRVKYGDGEGLYRTHLFGSPSIIACVPSVSKFVLQSAEKFALDWPQVDLVGRTSLFAIHGKAHMRMRSYVTKTINEPDALQRIAALVQPRMIAALDSWAQRGRIQAYDEAEKVTFENIGKLFVSLEPGPLLQSMKKPLDGLLRGFTAFPLNIPGSTYHTSLRKLQEIFRVELEKKKKQKGNIATNDVLDGLMQIKDEEGDQLSDREVLENIISLVVGGYSSTALASMWAIHCLAKFPNVLMKLREENMAISKHKTGEFLTTENVAKLKYTNKVVDETIRIANIAAFIFRLAKQEIVYKGYTIPKGWRVIVWIRYLHTNPENFDDPMCFNPDRWDEPARPGTFLAFGGGSRICAGNMLARTQLALFLHHLSTGYK